MYSSEWCFFIVWLRKRQRLRLVVGCYGPSALVEVFLFLVLVDDATLHRGIEQVADVPVACQSFLTYPALKLSVGGTARLPLVHAEVFVGFCTQTAFFVVYELSLTVYPWNTKCTGCIGHFKLPVFHVLATGILLFHRECHGSVVVLLLIAHQRVGDLIAKLSPEVPAHLALVVGLGPRIHVQRIPYANAAFLRQLQNGFSVRDSAITAALILADKTDVRASRVRAQDLVNPDIHDRVNYSVTASRLVLDCEKSTVTLTLDIDTEVASVMSYFEIFLGRMVMCRKAADKLGMTFRLIINNQQFV